MQNKLPERLKELRAEKELSQAKLANILGMPQQTYATWETGKAQPDIDMLQRLADFHGTSVDYLIGKAKSLYDPEEDTPHKPNQIIAFARSGGGKRVYDIPEENLETVLKILDSMKKDPSSKKHF